MNFVAPNRQAIFSPFHMENYDGYCRWRDNKLANYPKRLEDLIVEIGDPRKLTKAEFMALRERCRKANMAIYVSNTGIDPDPEIPLSVGRWFGVGRLNNNWLADETGLTSLKVAKEGIRRHYIPYTNRAINWHTDGYYNSADKQIQSLLLHVVQRAAQGGENALLDHEIVYILLREMNPDFISALMRPGVLTIPARIDEEKVARKEQSGPVFTITPYGDLHMRYTIRVNNVIWSDEPLIQEALASLARILETENVYKFQGLLEPGMGLVSNNVLHDRAAFTDDDSRQRHYYRARYFDRLAGTGVLDQDP
ncbi:MAG: TauD/TfdA family dioxygenase [Gammaproteobacteria bacterium]|nr:TauD/TfdA family dioxygenase [Gammaproteobacteria bacterium]